MDIDDVKELIARCGNVNEQDEKGRTPLHLAAQYGDLDMVKLLVNRGADPMARDKHGETALHHAAKGGRTDVANFLIGCSKGKLVNAGDMDGSTPLYIAALTGCMDLVELLVANGADVNAKDDVYGWTALHGAVENGHFNVAEHLIAQGANVNARGKERGEDKGLTPLGVAELNGKINMADLLRKHGATL